MARQNHLKLIDLFSGMGCASMGFKEAGFEPAVALEIDSLRCDLYKENIGIVPIQQDVMDTSGKDLLHMGGLRKGGTVLRGRMSTMPVIQQPSRYQRNT